MLHVPYMADKCLLLSAGSVAPAEGRVWGSTGAVGNVGRGHPSLSSAGNHLLNHAVI